MSRSVPFLLLFLMICLNCAHPCAMFTLARDGLVLFANNEDYIKPGYVWFTPGEEGKYGRINFGFNDHFAQGSMNEAGLCFDAATVPEIPFEPDPSKKKVKNLLEKIMDECAAVEEAKNYFEEYNCTHLSGGQFMFADRHGDSMVVSYLPDRGVLFSDRAGDFQLITNIRNEASGFRCERYVLAGRVLTSGSDFSVELARDALNEIHQEGKQAFTSYSNIFDPVNLKIYVYNLANYEEQIEFDLKEELAKGKHSAPLADLFNSDRKVSDVRDVPVRKFETEIQLDPKILGRNAGEYLSENPPATLTLSVEGNGLAMTSGEGNPAHLFPESNTSFRIREGGQITFDVAEDGSVRGFTLHRFGDHYAKRKSPSREE
ncbi:MAG: hypothetical protein H6751_14670 [Candidatus Omnitrophica bacterium]|nr:hypothetical protein [Candidatus Omnitrophota bacterium]